MDKQRESCIGREISAPVHDELLRTWVEISFSKWGRVDGVKQLAQLGDAHLDDPAFRRDQVSSGWRLCLHGRGLDEGFLLRVPGQDRIAPS